ncbi:TPA: replicative DNA helicase [Candidatus Poribacteria bacterium]|nr:replicative DNA helicase [Candidatus Poribacteria bacterium]HCK15061.1 replicative DNA helicase [Candidatus Poribacteria bacterium]
MRSDSTDTLHDRQAERAALGSMMTDPAIIPDVVDLLGASSEVFFTTDHQLIYDAILSCYERNNATDSLLVANELQNGDNINRAGGAVYLYDLQAEIVETENTKYYAEIIQEKYLRRRMVQAGQQLRELARDQQTELTEQINDAQEMVFGLSLSNQKRGFSGISSIIKTSLDEIADFEGDGGLSGIATGFQDFDHLTAGLHSGDYLIFAARPGMGKTTFVLNIAQNIAIANKNLPVAIFSLEMPRSQLGLRMLAAEARVDFGRLRTGNVNDEHWTLLAEASERFLDAPIFINDERGLKMQAIRSELRRLKGQHSELAVVIIDYIQLVSGSDRYSGREAEIAEISRHLKQLAGELELTVIACSQLSREVERRPDKRPVLSDLRESGSIEQDADLVAFLYRDDYYNEFSEDEGIAELIIKKQRNGPTGVVELEFHKEQMRFSDSFRSIQ